MRRLALASLLCAATLAAAGPRPTSAKARSVRPPDPVFKGPRTAGQGYTSDVHRRYAGEIVLAGAPVPIQKPDGRLFRRAFDLGVAIYGRIYLHRPIVYATVHGADGSDQGTATGGEYDLRIILEGTRKSPRREVALRDRLPQRQAWTWTTWQIAPAPVPLADWDGRLAAAWSKILSKLPPGEYAVHLELRPRRGRYVAKAPLALGKVKIRIPAGPQSP